MLKRLDHPNLVKILDADIVDQQLYFAMELVEGEPLSQVLGRRGKLAWDLAVDYLRQAAQGVDYLHQQDLLHLKLTPDKILVSEDGKVKVTDMRLNRARKRRWDDSRARVLDTAAYLAPEFLTGEDVNQKCDTYSLGVILFETITGKMPFEPETLARLVQRKKHRTPPRLASLVMECPVWIDRLVDQMIAGDPQKRPHTMHAVVLALEEVQKMDATQMGVAQKMVGGFNPLTAGGNKEEAKRVLGVKDKRNDREPIDLTLPAILGGLVLVLALMVGGIAWTFTPMSEEKLFAKAKALIESEDNLSLTEAKRDYLEPLLEKYPDGEYAEEAQELLDVADRRLAQQRMRLNYKLGRDPRSSGEEFNVVAWRREEAEEFEEAYFLYREGADNIVPEGRDRGHLLLARFKADELRELLVKDPEASDRIADHCERVATLVEEGKQKAAQGLAKKLIELYGEQPDLQAALGPLRELDADAETTGEPETSST